MSESLVMIRTYRNLLEADEAQIDLLSAGIYSLLYTQEGEGTEAPPSAVRGIGLAVHQRDAVIAEAVLSPPQEVPDELPGEEFGRS